MVEVVVGEAHALAARGEVGVVARVILRLLDRGAVVAEAVALHDQVQVGEEEVHAR